MPAQVDKVFARAARIRTLRRFVSYALFEGRPATTRGQWINPLVFAQLRVMRRLYGASKVEKPVFIVGVGRSGTTHLGRVLATHPQVGWLNEPKAMWHEVDAHEDVSGFYNTGSAKFRYSAADADVQARTTAHQQYRHYLKSVCAHRVVDKYPELTYRIPYLKALFPDSTVIAIVRRAKDATGSIVDWSVRKGRGDEDWWGVADAKWANLRAEFVTNASPDDPVRMLTEPDAIPEQDRALVEWIVGMRALVDCDPSDRPDLIVRAEDLSADPRGVTMTVLHACGLDEDSRTIEFAESATSTGKSYKDGTPDLAKSEVKRLESLLGYPD